MAISIDLYTFSKAKNSTKLPTGTHTTLSCVLKDDCSVLNPIIELQSLTSPQTYNYAYLAIFNRYYFVDDWSYNKGIWSAHLAVDPLASWKSYIGSSQYVVRAYQTEAGLPAKNELIVDNAYIAQASNVISQYAVSTSPYVSNLSSGTYIIGIINNDPDSTGAVSYYAMTQASFGALRQYLTDETNWSSLDTVFQAAMKYSFDPFRYIVSALYVPFALSELPIGNTAMPALRLGWWTTPPITGFICYSLQSSPIFTKTGSLGIPKHPDATAYGRYLNLNPYSRYTMIFRPFGEHALDATYLSDVNGTDPTTLYWTMKVDCITGVGILEVFNSQTAQNVDSPFQTFRASVGTPVQMAQITQDLIGTAVNVVSTVVSAANAVAGAVVAGAATAATGGAASAAAAPMLISGGVSVINGAYQAFQCALPQMSSQGSNGSYVEYAYTPHIFAQHFRITTPDPEHFGYPFYREVNVGQLRGYVQCANVELQAPCTAQEANDIKSFMEAGFYYE